MTLFAVVETCITNDLDGGEVNDYSCVLAIRSTKAAAILIAREEAKKVIKTEFPDGEINSFHQPANIGENTDENLVSVTVYEEPDGALMLEYKIAEVTDVVLS